MKRIGITCLIVLTIAPEFAEPKFFVSSYKLPKAEKTLLKFNQDSLQIKNKKLNCLIKKECSVSLQYPVIIKSAKNESFKLNRLINRFFEVSYFSNPDSCLDMCPADVFNRYKLKQTKSLLFITNSTFIFPTGAQHSYKTTATAIINLQNNRLIENEEFFKKDSLNSLKKFLIMEVKSTYNSNLVDFDEDYYQKEFNAPGNIRFFLNGDQVTFYAPCPGLGGLVEIDLELNYNQIKPFIKEEYAH